MSELETADCNELAQLHDAITRILTEHLTGVRHIEAFPDLENGFPCPALFFGMTEFQPGNDTGTGKTAIHGKFQAVILVDSVETHAALQGMWLATRLAKVLRGQYWDLEFTEEARDVHAVPDGSNPQLDGFVVWAVSWTQVFHIGEIEWPWGDAGPESLPVDPEIIVTVDVGVA